MKNKQGNISFGENEPYTVVAHAQTLRAKPVLHELALPQNYSDKAKLHETINNFTNLHNSKLAQ